MRALISKIVLLSAACILTMVWLAFGAGPYRHDFAIMLNKRELLAATPSPKLVLMGGSGLLYGIDSALLAKKLGVRVANAGFYAGCGSEFAADYIVPYLNEGDVVVLIPEYVQFEAGMASNDVRCRAWITRSLFPRIPWALYRHPRDLFLDIAYLARTKAGGMLRSLPYGSPVVAKAGDVTFFNQEFDEYGDKRYGFEPTSVLRDRERNAFDTSAIDRTNVVLREFARRVEERNAQFRLAPPAVAASWYLEEHGALEQLAASLDPKLLLGQPAEYVYDDSLFQDTIYHLGIVGRRLRTERLAEAIESRGLFSR